MVVWVSVTLVANGLEGGAALLANIPPLLWFLSVGVILVRRSPAQRMRGALRE